MRSSKKITAPKYFKTRLKDLPYHECFISSEYKEKGLAQVLISKKQPSGKYSYAIFLLDVFCLGVKSVIFNININNSEYEEIKGKLLDSEDFIPYNIAAAHNLIYGTIDAAEEIGFLPHKDFAIAEYILDEELIDDGIDDVEFGKDGKPLYISGPFDDVERIISTLERTVGEGNFDYVIGI